MNADKTVLSAPKSHRPVRARLQLSPLPADVLHRRIMSARWKPLVICPQPELAGRIESILSDLACRSVVHTDYPRMGSMAALAKESGSNICFLDVATNSEHAQVLIAELAPALPVIALH